MPRPVLGAGAASVHTIAIGLAEYQDVLSAGKEVLLIQRESIEAAKIYRQLGPAFLGVAEQLLRVNLKAEKTHDEMIRDINRVMARAALAAEGQAVKTLERKRRATGRAEQPEAFLSASGLPSGRRVRLRKSIIVGLQSLGPIDVSIHVGLLAILEKAVDRKGNPVWQAVEYPHTRSGPSRRGMFMVPGQSLPGAGSGQAVFVPGGGGFMRPRKLHQGYGFLEAGRNSAIGVMTRGLPKVGASTRGKMVKLQAEVRAIRAEALRIHKAQQAALAKEKRRQRYLRAQARRPS